MEIINTKEVRMVEGNTGEFGVASNVGISEVPDGGAESYLAAIWKVLRCQE